MLLGSETIDAQHLWGNNWNYSSEWKTKRKFWEYYSLCVIEAHNHNKHYNPSKGQLS